MANGDDPNNQGPPTRGITEEELGESAHKFFKRPRNPTRNKPLRKVSVFEALRATVNLEKERNTV